MAKKKSRKLKTYKCQKCSKKARKEIRHRKNSEIGRKHRR